MKLVETADLIQDAKEKNFLDFTEKAKELLKQKVAQNARMQELWAEYNEAQFRKVLEAEDNDIDDDEDEDEDDDEDED
jgi:hypothetical protein